MMDRSGIAAWALEKLPDDIVIDNWVQMQSALSPDYDLSKALAHVRHAYSFYSDLDAIVLGTGTRTVGTIDGSAPSGSATSTPSVRRSQRAAAVRSSRVPSAAG